MTIIDTAGVGGTSWARIEAQRARDLEIGELFADWGIPTPESIRQLREIPGLTIIGSGGVRNGIEAAKAIALGADLVGMAQPFLIAADESADAAVEKARKVARELKIAMFCVGARSVAELQQVELRHKNEG
jgi:isopentenyl-diphosphate delta-isomerase